MASLYRSTDPAILRRFYAPVRISVGRAIAAEICGKFFDSLVID